MTSPLEFWIIVGGWFLFILGMVLFRLFTGFNIFGTPSIHKVMYKTGKLALFAVGATQIAQVFGANFRMFSISSTWMFVSVAFTFVGFLIMGVAFLFLGKATRMGLPQEKTELKTNGLYQLSRNPMYVAAYFLLIGSVLYTVNLFILAIAVYAVIVHHYIILGEEEFLRKRFGKKYEEYCKKVRRYI